MIYGLLDTRTGQLGLTQAGHPSPILPRRGEDPRVLGDGGGLVGLWKGMEYETLHEQMNPGDRLVLYSDGITECADAGGVHFGEERLLDHLRAQAQEPLARITAGLEWAMETWRGGSEFADDVSLLTLQFD